MLWKADICMKHVLRNVSMHSTIIHINDSCAAWCEDSVDKQALRRILEALGF